jgi:cytoskeletal protein CcmA (bactofilin family)
MWGKWRNKKPETRQAQPETKNFPVNPPPASKPAAATAISADAQTAQAQPEIKKFPLNPPPASKPAAATREGTTAMSTDAIRPMRANADRATARLGPTLHVMGEISGNDDLEIEGWVEGSVQLEGKLTVGASGKVTADIITREVVVYGTVKGKVQATDRIEIKKDGSVNGDLTTARIVIEDGANFKGSIGVDKIGGEKESGGESFSRAASAAAGVGSKTI